MAGDRVEIRRAHVKVFESWFTSGSHFHFEAVTHGIGLRLLVIALRGTPDGERRWLTIEGRAWERKTLAHICRVRPATFSKHVQLFIACGTMLEREDGCLGFAHFEEWQRPTEADTRRMTSLRAPGLIYLVRAGTRVKIGFSANPWARVKEMQTASSEPMELLASWPGSMSDERDLHVRFAAHRVHGEWFDVVGSVADFVATIVAGRSSCTVATDPSSAPSPPSVSLLEPPFHSPLNPTTTSFPPQTPPQLPFAANESPWTESPAEAADRDREPPKRAASRRGKPRAAVPEGLAEHVLAELRAACVELHGAGAGPRKLTAGMLDSLSKLHAAEEPTADEWTRVIRRRLELDRAGKGYGELAWEHLCRPASFRRYRDEASPIAVPKPSGRHQPGPRPTVGGVVGPAGELIPFDDSNPFDDDEVPSA